MTSSTRFRLAVFLCFILFMFFIWVCRFGFGILHLPSRSNIITLHDRIILEIENTKVNKCRRILSFNEFVGVDDLMNCVDDMCRIKTNIDKYNLIIKEVRSSSQIALRLRYGSDYKYFIQDYTYISLKEELSDFQEVN